MRRVAWVFLLIFGLQTTGSAKGIDTLQYPTKYKNTVRYNLSNQWFFGSDNFVFGYERVLKPNRSVSVNLGLCSFPKLGSISFDSLEFEKTSKGSGFNVAVDYRFYLTKENKHTAPRGVYFAPYFSYTLMKRENSMLVKFPNGGDAKFDLDNKLQAAIAGIQLGYQFVFFKDRLAVDLVLLGPGYGWYNFQANLDTSLDPGTQGEIMEAIKDNLKERYPGLGVLFNGSSLDLTKSGYTSAFAYRYVVHFGYRF